MGRGERGKEKMTTKKLTEFNQIEMLYNTRLKKDFPKDELRPLDSFKNLWDKEAYECYGLVDGEGILGYAFFVHLSGNYLLDYFAIDSDHRDEGLGSLFLHQLSEILSANCIICEVEHPNSAEAIRRIQFYLRNRYKKTGLESTVLGVNYHILAATENTTEELRAIYTELYHIILPEEMFRTGFEVR